jgi:tripartite ATP-independent transporter DctM subunit
LPLIIYGTVYAINAGSALASNAGDSIQLLTFSAERFYLKAGLLPGAILVGAIAIYVVVIASLRKVPRARVDLRAAGRAFIVALPELLVPVVVLGVLAVTNEIPTAAAFAALYVLLIETCLYRDIKLKALPQVVRGAMGMVGAIFLVIVSATALTYYFIQLGMPEKVFGFITSHIQSKWAFLLALNGFLLVVGFLMEIFSAILVVVPLLIPAAIHYHIDPYHLGVIFLLNLEIGYLHPPVGMNLLISSYRFREPLGRTVVASLPFLLIMMVVLLAVTYIPALVPVKDVPEGQPRITETAGGGGAATADAGPIIWPDGAVWTPGRCDSPEMKDDMLAQAECRNMFTNYAKCNAMSNELDKLSCRQNVLAGGTGEDEDDEDEDEVDAGAETDAAPMNLFDAAPAH